MPYLDLIKPWSVVERGEDYICRIFSIRKRFCQSQTQPDRSGEFVYLDCPDWVNILALTPDKQLVMIEQFRPGSAAVTLETPGGMVDQGEDIIAAAARELREETGFVGDTGQLIGALNPNPAIQNNTCHYILFRNSTRQCETNFDPTEEIAVRSVALPDVKSLIHDQTIDHALVVAGYYFLLDAL